MEQIDILNRSLAYCNVCDFTYVLLAGYHTRSNMVINICPIDGAKLVSHSLNTNDPILNYLTSEEVNNYCNFIIYPQINMTKIDVISSSIDILTNSYQNRINENLKRRFLENQQIEKDDPDDNDIFEGEALGSFGFKTKDSSLKILHYTGRNHTQYFTINLKDIFIIEL